VANNATNTADMTRISDREYEMTRVFDAPRALVFEAYTDPKHVPNWWGPRSITTRVEESDLRPGGRWRYVQVAPDGTEYAFFGEYREVVPPEKVVSTFEFEGMPGHVVVDAITLTEENGKTTLTSRSTFNTAEDMEGFLATGAISGAIETYDRLAELLATLR
jgi:uncharacterized protein YndB with AHSA1/START domain